MFITISLVTYHNSFEDLRKVMDSIKLIKEEYILYVVDNSSDRKIEVLCQGKKIQYIKNKTNIGFGAAHNVAIKEAIKLESNFHLIVNPDIYFDENVIEEVISFFQANENIGLVMPKVLFPNGDTQYLCKLLPTPSDLFLRRFIPFKNFKKKHNYKYELRFSGYNKIMNVPCLSGCFMLCRTNILKEVEGFDERFFMYLEDNDLCRRIHLKYETLFLPNVYVYHKYEKGSYKNYKLLKFHIFSAIKYFNKWGWFFDSERKLINKRIIRKIYEYDEQA